MNTSRTDPTIRLLVLVGPTASGKTTLGVEVAHALRSEIVSADSRQVYRGLDIGSGKDLETYASVAPPVPYHLIDVADPTDIYSVYHYQRDCYALLESRAPVTPYREGRPLVMVGGTGLLVEAVLRGYRIPHVPENEALREQLMTRSREDLIRELGELDATRLAATDCSTRKRVVRAIEIATYAKDHTLVTSPPPPVRVVPAIYALDVPRDALYRNIDARLEARLGEGMIEEVEGLLAAGLPPARLRQLGLEYREVADYLTGVKGREAMVTDLRRGIRQLAKRQRTWFRGLPKRGLDVTWIDPRDRDRLVEHAWTPLPGQ